MTFPEITALLPHRYPLLLVDRIVELVPGKRIRTEFYVHPELPVFAGHFPGNPVFPGVYSIEAMTQTGVCLLMTDENNRDRTPLFLGVDNVRFLKPVRPKDTLEMTAEILSVRDDKPVYTLREEIRVSGETAAYCQASVFLKG